MSNIEAVFFDQGNVLDRYDDANRSAARRMGISYDDLGKLGAEFVRERHLGTMREAEYLAKVCGKAGIAPPQGLIFDEIYERERTVNEELLGVVRQIKEYGIKTGIISNAEDATKNFIMKRYQARPGLFDIIILSCDEKVAKPDVEIYTRALNRLGITDPARAVFVDDVLGHVKAFMSIGGRGIHYVNNEQTTGELSAMIGRALIL